MKLFERLAQAIESENAEDLLLILEDYTTPRCIVRNDDVERLLPALEILREWGDALQSAKFCNRLLLTDGILYGKPKADLFAALVQAVNTLQSDPSRHVEALALLAKQSKKLRQDRHVPAANSVYGQVFSLLGQYATKPTNPAARLLVRREILSAADAKDQETTGTAWVAYVADINALNPEDQVRELRALFEQTQPWVRNPETRTRRSNPFPQEEVCLLSLDALLVRMPKVTDAHVAYDILYAFTAEDSHTGRIPSPEQQGEITAQLRDRYDSLDDGRQMLARQAVVKRLAKQGKETDLKAIHADTTWILEHFAVPEKESARTGPSATAHLGEVLDFLDSLAAYFKKSRPTLQPLIHRLASTLLPHLDHERDVGAYQRMMEQIGEILHSTGLIF